jgi:hypothetical protein
VSSEAALQRRILNRLKTEPDIHVLKIVGGRYQAPGIADLILCWRGRFIAIELKAPGRINGICIPEAFKPQSLTERLQVTFLKDIIAAGGGAFFTDNYNVVTVYLELTT